MGMNNDLRKKIVRMVTSAGEGHIPSSFSIVDIIDTIYGGFLNFDPRNVEWEDRDYFILSKGHGAAALYIVLEKYQVLSESDIASYGKYNSILGGHPDRTKVPGAEASTGSLGHGLPFAIGIALGLKIQKKNNKVIVLIGDGECHEGTIWESALVAQNLKLNNLCCIVDFNGSAAQILPHPNMVKQWQAFGWDTREIDGHNKKEIESVLSEFYTKTSDKPFVIVANTIKGKGVSFMEVHGPWHHKIPNSEEFEEIMMELDK
ncbi:MAG: transketolase [Spirochaetae bacterium HGW-Spirochaetae-1]|jgi:transketolase|nr:MAG: transketolase [Spirochaetae bacterium HGW-Spirochaetae-1]